MKESSQQLNLPTESTANEIFHHLQHDWNFGGIKLDGNQQSQSMVVGEQEDQPISSSYANMLNQADMSGGISGGNIGTGSIATEIVQDDSHTTSGDCILQEAVADLIDDNSIEDNVDNVDDEAEAEEDEEEMDDNDAVRDIVDELQQQHEQIIQLQQQQQQQQLQQLEVEHFQQQEQQHHQQQQQLLDHHVQNHAHLNEYVGEVTLNYFSCPVRMYGKMIVFY